MLLSVTISMSEQAGQKRQFGSTSFLFPLHVEDVSKNGTLQLNFEQGELEAFVEFLESYLHFLENGLGVRELESQLWQLQYTSFPVLSLSQSQSVFASLRNQLLCLKDQLKLPVSQKKAVSIGLMALSSITSQGSKKQRL